MVMWAKNGASTLPPVLKRANEVLPHEAIKKKIFIDDHSIDSSRQIAEGFGWTIYNNRHGGIASGINTALSHVESDFFISLEQDVILAKDWFQKIPCHLNDPKVFASCGIRFPNHSIIKKMHKYELEKSQFTMGSIDNTIWKTKLVKAHVGPVPEYLRYGAADSYMRLRLEKVGYKTFVDQAVISIHLRKGGLKEEMKRFYLYGLYAPRRKRKFIDETENKRAVKIALLSPIRGIHLAVKTRCAPIAYYYPLIRFAFMRGALKRNENS
jgi:glycosyltransferase involved in cell wall biosynthesis